MSETGDEDKSQQFLSFLCRHLVSLGGTYVQLDQRGKAIGKAGVFSYSGFIVELNDSWWLLTAGHALRGLNEASESRKTRITHCNLVHYFGEGAKVHFPVPFDYDEAAAIVIDDDRLGLDFGLVRLRDLFRHSLQANNVRTFTKENWIFGATNSFDGYALLGLPEELMVRPDLILGGHGEQVIAGMRACLISLIPTDAVPREKPEPVCHWMAWELRDQTEISSAVGFSGGPIFGFKKMPDGRTLYGIVAVQSWWDKERRIVFGCSIALELIERAIKEFG